MRSIQTIDAELRVLATYRAACADVGLPVRSTAAADRILDERSSLMPDHRPTDGGPDDTLSSSWHKVT
ncbi:hypothetical protein [Mycolicibacterium goodii]|uniref:Uncharacterized protein n=1 Tax=Mycolicibacterium goodii TaxID=134601 RepID=A0ABS6HQE9_MYCGD|nr:hypothetical protein [Mycolicibacterium goodii]MBU8824140.1 hypothetical protein [Mycolicibacterium goodii]MBU8838077.1 hypothetical protein [Mycolicibacterium goodii]